MRARWGRGARGLSALAASLFTGGLVATTWGCSSEVVHPDDSDSGADPSGSSTVAGAGAAAASSTGAGNAAGTAGAAGGDSSCVDFLQCLDCVDNDGDGTIDAWDVECTSALDDDEGSFGNGIPDRLENKCSRDCYFDGNGGSGDDECHWKLQCDPKNPGLDDCPYDPAATCAEPANAKCLDACLSATPNGCDCFGCCAYPLPDGGAIDILLGGFGCTDETALDPNACRPCTRVDDCNNPCEACEYCLGKLELPPECGGITDPCAGDAPSCSPQVPCPASMYCQTGCCIDIPL